MADIVVTDRSGVREIAIDRPAKRNALTRAMYGALGEALAGAAAAGAAAVWLHGSAECFTAGNDLGDFARAVPGERSAAWLFLDQLVACETPIIASVNGAAVGVGATMLLHCDLVYCSQDAGFRFPFVDLGLCPEAASTLLLVERAGALLAHELLLLAEPFGSATALRAGLVNAVLASPEAADAEALRRAEALAVKPREALRTTRALLRRNRPAVLAAMREEGEAFARLLHAPDARAILAARLGQPALTSAPETE